MTVFGLTVHRWATSLTEKKNGCSGWSDMPRPLPHLSVHSSAEVTRRRTSSGLLAVCSGKWIGKGYCGMLLPPPGVTP